MKYDVSAAGFASVVLYLFELAAALRHYEVTTYKINYIQNQRRHRLIIQRASIWGIISHTFQLIP